VNAQPIGTVTLLFTDIEGSTSLLARLGAARYAETLAQHRIVMRGAIAAHGGYEAGTEGDSFFVVFGRADDAVAAASDAQRGLRKAFSGDPRHRVLRTAIDPGAGLERLFWQSGRAGTVNPAALGESPMNVQFVVLYVNDAEVCRTFWVERVGMVEKQRSEVGSVTITQVGFADQAFAFQLVPLEMMKDNPSGLDLATPSICFQVDDLDAERARLVKRGVQATEVGEHQGTRNFAFADPEGRWFAVTP